VEDYTPDTYLFNTNPDAVNALWAPGIPLSPEGDSPPPEVLMGAVAGNSLDGSHTEQ
jgi:hypothetical protein